MVAEDESAFIHISSSLMDLIVRKDFIKTYRGYCLIVASFGMSGEDYTRVDANINLINEKNAVCLLKIFTPYFVKYKGMYCARFVKTHIHKFCQKAIWMDTHYMTAPIDKVVDTFGGHSLVLHRHWFVNDMEGEFDEAFQQQRYIESGMQQQMDIYRKKFSKLVSGDSNWFIKFLRHFYTGHMETTGFPDHFASGLFSVDTTGLKDGDAVSNLMEEWWIHNYLLSFEDQITLPLLLMVHHVEDLHILGDGHSTSPCNLLLEYKGCLQTKGKMVRSGLMMNLSNNQTSTLCDGVNVRDSELTMDSVGRLFTLRQTLRSCGVIEHPSNHFINLVDP